MKAAEAASVVKGPFPMTNPGEIPWYADDTPPEDSTPVATHLENELRRRDRELLAEWRNVVANGQSHRIVGMGLVIPWSTIDAILKALDPVA